MQLNTLAPDFSLPDQHGKLHCLSDYRGQIVIVNFWSAECPWSERTDKSLLALIDRYPGLVTLLPVASNMSETDKMVGEALRQRGLPLVLRDTADVADTWQAQTTPHVFVIDKSGSLRYRGAVDDVTFRKKIPTRFYVAEAVEALASGKLPEVQETSPYGCLIVRNL